MHMGSFIASSLDYSALVSTSVSDGDGEGTGHRTQRRVFETESEHGPRSRVLPYARPNPQCAGLALLRHFLSAPYQAAPRVAHSPCVAASFPPSRGQADRRD